MAGRAGRTARTVTKRRPPARPHRHSWQAIAVGSDGRIIEGCTVDRCIVTRVGDGRQVGFWIAPDYFGVELSFV